MNPNVIYPFGWSHGSKFLTVIGKVSKQKAVVLNKTSEVGYAEHTDRWPVEPDELDGDV